MAPAGAIDDCREYPTDITPPWLNPPIYTRWWGSIFDDGK